MPISLHTNPTTLVAQRALAQTLANGQRTAAHLASARRIVEAFEDAAGLAIADHLHRDAVVGSQAIRNASDGLSVTRIADGALGQIGEINMRLSELAAQASSGTVDDAGRAALQQEFGALVAEIDRIAATTTFNGQPLLGGAGTIDVHVGIGGDDGRISFVSPDASAAGLGLDTLAIDTVAGARAALDATAAVGAQVAHQRGAVGAIESRIRSAISNLRVAVETSTAAESRLRDADFAREVADHTRSRILAKMQVAVLAQTNQRSRHLLA